MNLKDPELLKIFDLEVSKSLELLEKSWHSQDLKSVSFILHKLKGSFSIFKSELCKELELKMQKGFHDTQEFEVFFNKIKTEKLKIL